MTLSPGTPEAWCRPSMFCVMTAVILPCSTRRASARWPALGVALRSVSSTANRRRQDSRRASVEARKSENSIGLYRVQMPPGERKSGMPDSVEMPAPVKATMLRAAAIMRLNSSIFAMELSSGAAASRLRPALLELPDVLEADQAAEAVEGVELGPQRVARSGFPEDAVDPLQRLGGGEEAGGREDGDPVAQRLQPPFGQD